MATEMRPARRLASLSLESQFRRAADNSIRCWGNKGSDRLGDGTGGDAPLMGSAGQWWARPVDSQGRNLFKQVPAGKYHTCATIRHGTHPDDARIECRGNEVFFICRCSTIPPSIVQ